MRRWRGEHPTGTTFELDVDVADTSPLEIPAARRWLEEQSVPPTQLRFRELHGGRRIALGSDGSIREPGDACTGRWGALLSGLPEACETALESALLVATSEEVDAIAFWEDRGPASHLPQPWLRLFAAARFLPDARENRLVASAPGWRARNLSTDASCSIPPAASSDAGFHREGYESDLPIPDPLVIDLVDPASIPRPKRASSAPRVLVLAPFLARGGAEHTLFETSRALAARGELEFAFVTLAPHRPELGDRRPDFRAVSPLIYSLGDLLHPDAMYGALLSLVDSLDTRLVYNANGSTLFYDYARRLRRDRPAIPIVDHLYDHEVGYITWYDAETPSFVDFCVAENRRIADKLVAAGWEKERVPVIWPCGRPAAAFPPDAERAAARRELRRELGVGDDELLLLTAARAHPQKRPLDWVRLGERLRGEPVRLLWVGGGDLERELDAAIAESPAARLARLPFRDDVPRLLLAADAALLVSEFEGLPVFLLEALQAGTPFVATDVGDIGDLARATGAGLVSGAPGDLDALAAAARRLLDPAVRGELAARAAASGSEYGVDGCARRYGDLFQRALSTR